VVSLVRRSRAYWLQAATLAAAALVPLAANVLFNVGPARFRQLDLTPVLLTGSGAVLAWGLFQQRLLRLAPVARGLLIERMSDPVLVLDAYGHVVDVNPAAARLLGLPRVRLTGRAAVDVLPEDLRPLVMESGEEVAEVRIAPEGARARAFEVRASPLPGRSGQPGGRLLVLRDVTERAELEQRLRDLLSEQARVAEALAQSLRPRVLPTVTGLRLAAGYRPADAGREIGGDFYDVFRVGEDWAFVLGDVSGKGAQAASATASARYTLRAVTPTECRPARALALLDGLLDGQLGEDVYLTAVHGRVRVHEGGACIRLSSAATGSRSSCAGTAGSCRWGSRGRPSASPATRS
jgi:PAS domain S-box-containing protein